MMPLFSRTQSALVDHVFQEQFHDFMLTVKMTLHGWVRTEVTRRDQSKGCDFGLPLVYLA